MGSKIKQLRKSQGMTLEEVGNIVGVGKSTVRKWENGLIANMRRDKIDKLAKALDTTPAYLMGWDEGLELVDTDIIADIMTNPDDLDHVQKLVNLNSTSKSIVYNMIDALYDKEEGH